MNQKLTKLYIQEEDTAPKKQAKSSGSKNASKKNYFSRNKDGVLTKKRKERRAEVVKKRKAYWVSPEGEARKEAKMNTPEKIEKRKLSKMARHQRRVERQLAEQTASREDARQKPNMQAGW